MSKEYDASSASRPPVPPSTRFPADLCKSRDLKQARRYLRDLSVHYDQYLDKILDKYYSWSHMESEIDEIIGNVKDHLFWPDDERLASDSFWLWRYLPGGRGRLRYYLTACAKNFARDKLRRKHPLRIVSALPEGGFDVPAASSSQLLNNARQIRTVLTEYAKERYREECGDGANTWRAFELASLSGEELSLAEIARRLGITEYMANNYTYKARQRIMELIWLALYDLEKADVLNDAIAVIDTAVITAIATESEKRPGDGFGMNGYGNPSAVTADETLIAKDAAACAAADSDMVELFGFLPKVRTLRKMPRRS